MRVPYSHQSEVLQSSQMPKNDQAAEGLVLIPLIYLILTILMLGFLSLLERVLLASVQLRQGPSTPAGNGFTLPIADGLKLYSKSSTDFVSSSGSLLWLSAPVVFYSSLALTVPYNSWFSYGSADSDVPLTMACSIFSVPMALAIFLAVSSR